MTDSEPADEAANATAGQLAAPEFEVITGDPSLEELAAVTAVISSLIEELEDSQRAEVTPISAWHRSQTGIRTGFLPGVGAWRSFSA